MKKRYQLLLCLLTQQMTVNSAGINIPRLQEEFNRVGLYNPLSPGVYNEQRAAQILNQLQKNAAYRPLANNLRRQQLESLLKIPTSQAEMLRLQQENQQMRDRIAQLNLENEQLRRRSGTGPSMGATGTPASNAELKACEEKVRRFSQLASQVISGLNEFERIILDFEYNVEESESGFFQWIYRRANETAQRFINSARTQIQNLSTIRSNLEALFTS